MKAVIWRFFFVLGVRPAGLARAPIIKSQKGGLPLRKWDRFVEFCGARFSHRRGG